MSCQITFNDNNTYDVKSPNGESSILYAQLVNSFEKDHFQALESWLAVYTKPFKEWFGMDWETLSEEEQSKLIKEGYLDQNGEPAMFFRGEFKNQDSNYSASVGGFTNGVYITDTLTQAGSISNDKVYPVMLKPSKSITFKNVQQFEQAVSTFNKIKTTPTKDQVNLYIADQHLKGVTVIGQGVSGKEINTHSKENIKSIVASNLGTAYPALLYNTEESQNLKTYMSEAYQETRKTNQFVTEFIGRLASNLGMQNSVEIISEADAQVITKDSPNPWSGQPAFFHDNKVYFIEGLLSFKSVFHEFAHPFIKSLRNANPVLFKKVFTELMATPEGVALMEEAKKEYPTLAPDHKLLEEEVIVKAMTSFAKSEGTLENAEKPSKGFVAAIKKLLFGLKQMLRKVFKKNFQTLSPNTSIKDLADLMVNETWVMSLDTVSNEDVIAYMTDIASHTESLMKLFNSPEGRATVHQQVLDNIFIVNKQLSEMKNAGNYEDLAIALSDPFGTQDQALMKQNLRSFTTTALKDQAYNQKITDLEQFTKKIEALAFNLTAIDDSVNRIKDHISDLKDEPDQRKALSQVTYYVQNLDQWNQYLEEFLLRVDEFDIDSNSPLVSDMTRIKENISRAKNSVRSIYKATTKEAMHDVFMPLVQKVTEDALEEIKKLQESLSKGNNIKTIQAAIKEQQAKIDALPTEDDMLDYLTGQKGDIGPLHAWLESYTNNQDPSIASFSMFIKKHLSEVQTATHQKYNEFITKLDPLLKQLGISPSQLNKFSKQFLFLDKSYTKNEEGELVPYEVYTFLNEFKNYKYETARLNDIKNQAEIEWNMDPSSEEKTEAFINAVHATENHNKYFFNKPYVDEYYHASDELNSTVLGRKANKERQNKLAEIQFYQKTHESEYELYEDFETVEVLWRDYKQMFSLYNGIKMKQGEELEMAAALRKHRDVTRDFYDYTPIPGAFNTALRQFEMKAKLKLKEENYKEGPIFEAEFAKRRRTWLNRNTQVKLTDSFYETRASIIDRISEIMNHAETETDFSANWEEILDSLTGNRDNDGQPVGTILSEEHLGTIKKYEEDMYQAKQDIEGSSGVTPRESNMLGFYYEKMRDNRALTPEEAADFARIKSKKNKLGLPEALSAELKILFKDLGELQTRIPTDYYVSTVSEHLEEILGTDFKPEMIEIMSSIGVVNGLFKKSEAFKEWFLNNHYIRTVFNEETNTKQDEYVRSYAWSIIRPSSPEHYEYTQLYDGAGTPTTKLPGVPTIKYSERKVKDEFHTGYDKATGEVNLVTGKHKDADGRWLPKTLQEMEEVKSKYAEELAEQPYAYDSYINHDYDKLKRTDPVAYQTLEVLKEFHLEAQEGLEKNGKLGLELPRFRNDRYQYVTTGGLKEDGFSKWNQLKGGITQIYKKRKDDADDILNYDEQVNLVAIDKFSGDAGKVPIRGKYRLEADQVSQDITTSLLTYYQSAEQNKRLREIQPIAKAMQALAEGNPADLKSISKSAYQNSKVKEYIPGNTNRRKQVIDAMVETVFEGKKLTGIGSENATANKIINATLGMASHAFFAYDITSAMKNFLGAQFQIALEGAGGKYFTYTDWHRGRPWANAAMWEISGQIYKTTAKSQRVQLIEVFDAIQGRFEEKFGESLSRSFQRDAINGGWSTTHRKWLETEATLQLFSAIMHSTKVNQTLPGQETKRIRYIDAWQINPTTNTVELKPGIDKTWGIDGAKFIEIKFRNHEVSNLLQGAYAKFDQPIVSRFMLWKMVSSMRKYFTKMAINRYGMRGRNPFTGKERYNIGLGDMHMGFYVRNLQTMMKVFRTGGKHLLYMSKDERRAFKMGFLELAKLQLLTLSYFAIWGFDDEDKNRWVKLKDKSGALPGLFTAEKYSENWNLKGWLANHTLLLAMNVEAENEHFIPWPTAGLNDMISLGTESSVVSGPSVLQLSKLFTDVVFTMTGDDAVNYKKDVGALTFQQEGSNKFWKHLGQMVGLKGKFIDPATSVKNYRSSRTGYGRN